MVWATTRVEVRRLAVGRALIAGRRGARYIRAIMLELRLLGLHALRGPDGRELGSLLAQPKRFALLAYLAITGSGGYHRRDSLAAMFWPDLDQFAARRALRNTLYHLREALGDGVIVVRGDSAVSIDCTMLTCDVTRLADAVDAGRFEEAVDCYRGELLAGVHVENSGEAFEEWLSRERLKVGALVLRALRGLVEREEQAGNIPAAARWAQRACALAPDDESWLRRGMSLLHAAGDTGGAMRLYESCAHRLATEFDAPPSEESQALAARIRNGGQGGSARGDAVQHAPPVVATVESIVPAPAGRRPARGRRAAIWTSVLGAAGVLALLAARAANARHPNVLAVPRVLVTVFENRTGDAHLQSLGRMTQDWLAQGIVRTQLVDVVDPRAVFVQARADTGTTVDPIALAQRTGATIVVSGGYYSSNDTLLVQAGIMDVRTGRIVRVVGPIGSSQRTPVAALNELRSRVMTALAAAVNVRATRTLAGTDEVPLFEAYQPYVDGWDAYWHGDGRRAEALFLQAAHRDTEFTAAAIAAMTAAANSSDCSFVDSIARALGSRRSHLDHVDRLTLQIETARCHGRNDEMLRLAIERAELKSNTSGDKLTVAAAALWANRPGQTVSLLEHIDPAVDLAWSMDSSHIDYWSELTEALHLLGRHAEELAVADRVPRSAPLSRAWMRGRALVGLSRPAAVLALLDSARAIPAQPSAYIGLAPNTEGRPQYSATVGWVAEWMSRELLVHGDTAASREAAARAIAWLRNRPAEERRTMEERLVASWSLEMAGEYAEAERIVRDLLVDDSTNVDFRGELAGLAAERGDTALADSQDRWLSRQPAARVGWSASVYRARVAALLGRPTGAVARTRDALDQGAWPLWIHAEPALATLRKRADFVELTAPRN
jgi:DNA-binding SARP family transcriptional activator/TolB-like protein